MLALQSTASRIYTTFSTCAVLMPYLTWEFPKKAGARIQTPNSSIETATSQQSLDSSLCPRLQPCFKGVCKKGGPQKRGPRLKGYYLDRLWSSRNPTNLQIAPYYLLTKASSNRGQAQVQAQTKTALQPQSLDKSEHGLPLAPT